MMDCRTLQKEWQRYLRSEVAPDRRDAIEAHLGECQACQAMPVLDPRLSSLLQDRLPRHRAPEALRARILAALDAEVAAPGDAAAGSAAAASWVHRLLGSSWTPRLAMAAVVVLMALVAGRSLWVRDPAMATYAVDSYERHFLSASPEALPCCHLLPLQPGDPLTDLSKGVRVPDLTADGLEFVLAGRCDDRGIEKTVLVYQSKEGQMFSLYIADGASEDFQEMRSGQVGAIRQVRRHVHSSEVTIWESAGLVWFWIGPYSNPEYSTALADLRTL